MRLWQLWYLFVATFLKTCFTEAYMLHRNSSPIISVNSLNFVLKQKEGTWVLQETETGKTVLFITLLNLVNLVSYLEVFSTLFLNKKCPIASTSQYEPSRFIHKAQEMFSTRSCLRDYRGKNGTLLQLSQAELKIKDFWICDLVPHTFKQFFTTGCREKVKLLHGTNVRHSKTEWDSLKVHNSGFYLM